jgi:hypothetical protein
MLLAHELARDRPLGVPDVKGIMLDPARLREQLTEFLLRDMPHSALEIEQYGAGAGSPLVKSEQEFFWHAIL